jgi:hypothetical protein
MSAGRKEPSERTQPPSTIDSSVPTLVHILPRWWATNQMSLTLMVWPSCFTLPGHTSGATAPDLM